MKVQSIQLRHSCHFSDLKIKFNPLQQPVCLILGNQASGKTTILKNIYHSLSWFSARLKDLRTAGIIMLDTEIKNKTVQSKIDISVIYPTEIGLIENPDQVEPTNDYSCSWQLFKTLTSQGLGHSKVQTVQLESLIALYLEAIKQDPLQGLPLIAYYPSDRFINEINLLSKNNPAVLQIQAAYELSPLPYTTFARFFEWFREISDIEHARLAQIFQRYQSNAIQDSENLKSLNPTQDTDFNAKFLALEADLQLPSLKTLKDAVNTIFPSITDIYIDYSPKIQLMVCEHGVATPFVQLSNSQRQWICLIGDVVRRLCILNPQSMTPCLDGDGILIIDNIDSQMDEDLQQNILSKLHAVFPRVQIIASACSELLLSNDLDFQYLKIEHQNIIEIPHKQLHHQYDELYAQLLNSPVVELEEQQIQDQLFESESIRLFEQFKTLNDAEKYQFMQYIQRGDFPSISST